MKLNSIPKTFVRFIKESPATYRRLLAILLVSWLVFVITGTNTTLVLQQWIVSVVMTAGSFIAGLTALGGGAVAYPVFTKVLGITPDDARTFSLLIQAIGMTMASIVIFFSRNDVPWRTIGWMSTFAAIGHFVSLQLPNYSPVFNRLTFTCLVFTFALTLFGYSKQSSRNSKKNDTLQVSSFTSFTLLAIASCIGGILAGQLGTGLDIIVCSMLLLSFNLHISHATAISVIMMAINSVFGAVVHAFILQDVSAQTYHAWLAAIPVVVIGAPFGAWVCVRLSGQISQKILFGLISVEVLSTFFLIPGTFSHVGFFIVLSSIGLLVFRYLTNQSNTTIHKTYKSL